jgi:hypothetical protein
MSGAVTSMFDVAMDIARRRMEKHDAMRQAFEQGDTETAMKYAQELCGYNPAGRLGERPARKQPRKTTTQTQ